MPNEMENSFAPGIGNAAYLCGNVHTDPDKISIFLLGLLPVMQPIITLY